MNTPNTPNNPAVQSEGHRPQRDRNTRRNTGRDEGSLLLAILFTLMISGLVLVATATVIAGLNKTRDSRDYAIALQAADAAFSDAVLTANLNPDRFTTLPENGTTTSGPPQALGSDTVEWTWTATRIGASNQWTLDIHATGDDVDRNFTSTLKGTRVQNGFISPAGTVRYTSDGNEFYTYGFFGKTAVNLTGTPIIDGYNGEYGTIGSNANIALGSAELNRLVYWDYRTGNTTGRCTGTGTACTTPTIDTVPTPATFSTSDLTTRCADATLLPAWSNNGVHPPLQAGRCYASITILASTNYTPPSLSQPVYSKGDVIIQGSATANTISGTSYNTPSGALRIATLANYTQATQSKVSLAIYAPNGTCSITGGTETQYRTVFLGALTCNNLSTSGNVRLRHDGGLDLYANSATNGRMIFDVYGYTSQN